MRRCEIAILTRRSGRILGRWELPEDDARRTLTMLVRRYNLERLCPGRAWVERYGSSTLPNYHHVIACRPVVVQPAGSPRQALRNLAEKVFMTA